MWPGRPKGSSVLPEFDRRVSIDSTHPSYWELPFDLIRGQRPLMGHIGHLLSQ